MAITSLSTFNALTDDYNEKFFYDNIFRDTATLEYARRNTVNIAGKAWHVPVRIAKSTPAAYARGAQLANPTTISGELGTEAAYTVKYIRLAVLLENQDVILNNQAAIANLLNAYITDAAESMRMYLSSKLFSAQTGNEIDSLIDACNDSNWGGINPATAGYGQWKCHVMEDTTGSTVPVSPSLANMQYMANTIQITSGKAPPLAVVNEALWNVLAAQVLANPQLAGWRSGPVVNWGLSAFRLAAGTEVAPDRDCPGSAWSTNADRVTAAGYEALFLNWDHVKLGVIPERNFKWRDKGWDEPDDYDRRQNVLYFWGTIGCNRRIALGHIFNVDLTQNPTDFVLGTITLPG